MDSLATFAIYVAVGAAAGLMSGLFGIGGGLVMVPALLGGFALAGMPAESIPGLALGTSLSVICLTSALASREHWRIGNLVQPFSDPMPRLAAMLGVGVVAGAAVSTRLPKEVVLLSIAVLQVSVAICMARKTFRPAQPSIASLAPARPHEPPQGQLHAARAGAFLVVTGAVSSIGGIGGATLMIPYFSRAGIDYPKAAALSSFFGCVIGAFGCLSYAFLAQPPSAIPLAVGYVSLPAFACMALGSLLCVRHGARLSMRLSKATLTRGFCCFLFASGGKILLPMAMTTLFRG
ncbi:MAG: sulfite exporter TauE/SafE family protein [Caldimonas sp.]